MRFALSEGFTSYGFSSHAPLPFSTAWTMEWDIMDGYLSEFHRLKEKYAGRIELYIGLEIDYLNEASNPSIARFRELPLDYRIGSVHLLYNDKVFPSAHTACSCGPSSSCLPCLGIHSRMDDNGLTSCLRHCLRYLI